MEVLLVIIPNPIENDDGDLRPFVLEKFYLTLLWAALSSLLGSQFFPTSNYGCLLTGIGTWLFSAYFFLAPMQKRNQRFWFLMTASYCMWAFITPFLSYWLGVESSFVASLLMTCSFGYAILWVVFKWIQPTFDFSSVILCSPAIAVSFIVAWAILGSGYVAIKVPLFWAVMWCCYVATYTQHAVWKYRMGIDDYLVEVILFYLYFPGLLIHAMKDTWTALKHFLI